MVGFAPYSTLPPPRPLPTHPGPCRRPHCALTVGKVMLMMLKRPWSLGEMAVRPPPGGPMAAIRNMSWGAETGRAGTGERGTRQGTGLEGSEQGCGEGPGQNEKNKWEIKV